MITIWFTTDIQDPLIKPTQPNESLIYVDNFMGFVSGSERRIFNREQVYSMMKSEG